MVLLKENEMDPRAQAMMAMMAQQQQGMGTPGMAMPPPEQAMPQPGPTIPDEMTDEDMLASVQSQMGGGGRITGTDMQADQAIVEQEPTDGNISAFIDAWGEENLPPSMRDPDAEGDDYARPGD